MADIARLFSLSDLHLYLTAPFVLSWSLFNALACGTTVLASDTAPVRELITAGENGLLADFFDIDEFVRLAERVLDCPNDYRHLGANGRELIQQKYGFDDCASKLRDLYELIAGRRSKRDSTKQDCETNSRDMAIRTADG